MQQMPVDVAAPDTIEPTPIVRVAGLTKHYGKFTAVNGLSFVVHPGEIFGLLGPNGAGKTTTLEIIEGIRPPGDGTVTVFGLDVRQQRRAIQQRIGVQLQATTLFPELTVRETIALFASFYPQSRPVDALLHEVALEEKARTFPQHLSGGQRQRLALALALVNDPELVFLDEPTSGLDPQSRRALWEIVAQLRERGKAVILTTHFMDEAQTLCDRIAIVDHGQIIALDTPDRLIASLGASATIACRLGPGRDGAAITPQILQSLPAVSEVHTGQELTTLYTEQTEQTLVALLHLAEAHGAALEHLEMRAPTLEDVFLKLTGRELRD